MLSNAVINPDTTQPEASKDKTADDDNDTVGTDNGERTDGDETKPEEQTVEKKEEVEISEEEKQKLQKRRQSMLWGYINASNISTVSEKTFHIASESKDFVFNDFQRPAIRLS